MADGDHDLRYLGTASAPGRVCLAGEHLDWMCAGPSIVAAIPLRTTVHVWRSHRIQHLVLTSFAPVFRTREIVETTVGVYTGDPLDYMHAAARRSARSWETLAGTVLRADTRIPIGAGVSSSAAITLATAAGIHLFLESAVESADALCELAYLAESVDLGVGSGWMDFMACGFGGVSRVEACSPPRVKTLSSTLGTPIVLIDTHTSRSTKSVIASLRRRLESNEGRVRDYVLMTAGVVDELAALVASAPLRYEEIGGLLDRCQYALQHLLGCSTDLIDECVIRCRDAGAFGVKLTGAGCGGALFALVPPDAVGRVLAKLAELPVAAKVLPDVEQEGVR